MFRAQVSVKSLIATAMSIRLTPILIVAEVVFAVTFAIGCDFGLAYVTSISLTLKPGVNPKAGASLSNRNGLTFGTTGSCDGKSRSLHGAVRSGRASCRERG